MHGWREDIATATRGETKPENLLYIMFAHTASSQAKGVEFLARFVQRREGRDTRTTDAARDAQYDAIVNAVEGWDPPAWRMLSERLSKIVDWRGPVIPGPRDPAPFAGEAPTAA